MLMLITSIFVILVCLCHICYHGGSLFTCGCAIKINCMFKFLQEQITPHLSSIFLRMLFLPGIYHNSVLRATLQNHNKHLTDSEFHSLTADGMKKEIVSVIEHEVSSDTIPLQL